MSKHKRAAFTLVELLVVIGIIALLISILLPALNKARQSANSLDCQARMRSIGQMVHMYASQYKGGLPPANFRTMVTATTSRDKHVALILSEMMKQPEWQVHPMFHDKDTIEMGSNLQVGDNPYSPLRNISWTSHYTPNIRLFPSVGNHLLTPPGAPAVNERYPALGNTGKQSAYRNMGDVKQPSNIAAWWDASQCRGFGNSTRFAWAAYPYSDGTDNFGWHSPSNRFVSIDNVNTIGRPGGLNTYNPSRTAISTNLDAALGSAQGQGGVRFRHLNNKSANILYLDGHVGSHTWNPQTGRTTMEIREFGCNFKAGPGQ